MEIPLQVTFHGVEASEALRQLVGEKAAQLSRYCDRILRCRVAVELEGRHGRQGKQFRIRVHLAVPGRDIVVSHEHHEDARVALREAFVDARRQLEDHVRIQRDEVKQHAG